MAKSQTPPTEGIVVTQERLKAAYQNLLERKSSQRLAGIIDRNFGDLQNGLKLPKGYKNLIDVIDALHTGKDKGLKKNIIAQIVEGNPKNFLSRNEEKRIEREAKGELLLLRGAKRTGEFLNEVRQFNIGNALKKSWPLVAGTADILHGARLKANIGLAKGIGINAAAWTLSFGVAHAAISPNFEPLPQPGSTTIRTTVSEACSSDFMKTASYHDKVYATTFSNSTNIGTRFAYNAIMGAAGHGVPLIALHNTSYLESAGHTDMMAGNSSASSLFQVIDSQKLPYLKQYGQQTFAYQEAKERIASGQSTGRQLSDDRLLVQAIDFVSEIPLDQLRSLGNSTNPNGPVFQALRLVDDAAMVTELVALDMKTQMPEITNPNLSPQEILELSAEYYREHHFLGMPNHTLLERLADASSSAPISASAQFLGGNGQQKLITVADGNPGLLDASMTGAQALDSISSSFMRKVQTPQQIYANAFEEGKSKVDLCVTEKIVPTPQIKSSMLAAINNPVSIETPLSAAVSGKDAPKPKPRPAWADQRPTTPTHR